MAAALEAFLDALNQRDVPRIITWFASGGTIEDPVGSGLYDAAEGLTRLVGALPEGSSFTLNTSIRTSHGSGAAMAFTARLPMPDGPTTIDSIDVMQFNDDGLIIEMHAYYGEQNVVVDQR